MKLWLKISLVCTVVLFLIVGLCSTILIVLSRDSILKLTLDNALTEQKNLSASFSEMMSYYGNGSLSAAVKRSMAQYCFSSFADEDSVLIYGDETICTNIYILPEEILPLSSEGQQYYMDVLNGRNMLIVGSRATVLSDLYDIYIVHDITPVYNSIAQLMWKFGIISFVSIVIGIVMIILLVRYAAKPFKLLGLSARRIAQGEYAERVKVSGHDEIGALTEDFNEMADAVQYHITELEETAQKQQLFIGGLTHEFKTPLTSVIGHSETLLHTKMPEDVVANSLTHINEQCKWLERLTQKLLALIVLRQEIELKNESVDDLLESVKNSMDETLHKRKIKLEVTCKADVLPMDFDMMKSLLINLIDNAAKASKPGQTVSILACDHTIEVIDHGVGIPEDDISKITEPFYMVDRSRSKISGGSGLGLALVKQIAEAHHIKLQIKSELGKGTIVRLDFPR